MAVRRRFAVAIGAVLVGATAMAGCGSGSSVSAGDDADGSWTVLEPSPLSPRSGAAAVWTGREVVVFGGIDLRSDASETTDAAGPPQTALAAPTSSAPVVAPTPMPPPTRPAWARLDGAAYDPDAGTWRTIAPVPAPDGYTPRSVTADGDRMTAFFGLGGVCALDVPVPDPAGAWYDAGADAWSTIPRHPFPYSCTPSGAWSDGKLWLVEGANAAVYDPAGGAWTTVASPSPDGDWGDVTLHPIGDTVVALGTAPSNEAESYQLRFAVLDVATRTWTELAAPPVDATGPGVVVGDRLVVFDPQTTAAAAWDPATRAWTRLPDAPIATRVGNAAVAVGNRLIVWGGVEAPRRVGQTSAAIGFEPGAPLDDGAELDLATGTWAVIADSPVPGRMDAAAVGTDDELVAWGGQLIEPTDSGSHPVARGDGARYLVGAGVDPSGPTTTAAPSAPPTSSTEPPASVTPGSAAPAGTAPDATVTVYVATGTIRRGSTGDQVVAEALVARSEIPVRFRPSTAIQSVDVLRAKVAIFDIAPDTVIVEGMFVDPPPP